ncbi:leptin receptor isoform X2 [Amia ocellicauda]
MQSLEKVLCLVYLAVASLPGVAPVPTEGLPRPVQAQPGELALCCGWPDEAHKHNEGLAADGPESGHSPNAGGGVSAELDHRDATQSCLWTESNATEYQIDSQEMEVVCLNILCWADGNLEHLICNLKPRFRPPDSAGLFIIRMRYSVSYSDAEHMSTGPEETFVDATHNARDGEDFLQCVIPIETPSDNYSLAVTITHGFTAVNRPVMRVVPRQIVKPNPPLNLQYNMTPAGELSLSWTDPLPASYSVQYEVRYSTNTSEDTWQRVESVPASPATLSGLRAGLAYTAQVRCRLRDGPGLWSDWSGHLYIYLNEVTYLPARILASTGSNVTVYCIFNNRNVDARNVVWWLNTHEKVPESQYSVVNERVSSVTLLNVRPQKRRGRIGFDVLQCCQQDGENSVCNYRYAAIYAQDISVEISCETNEYLTNMTCKWTPGWPQDSQVKFLYRIGRSCAALEADSRFPQADECPASGRGSNTCTFQPLYMLFCYAMWLENQHELGTMKSNLTYVTPMDVVKPHPPFNLEAEITAPDGYLSIRWQRTELPVYDLQFKVRYAVDGTHVEWKFLGGVYNQSAVIAVADPCVVYVVQVCCGRLDGPGHWSVWSSPVYTAVHDIRAPEWGPDFWRVIQEDPAKKQTSVTLLMKPLRREDLFCSVEGFQVQHQTSTGSTWSEHLNVTTAHTFVWTEDQHSVSVLAFNSRGASVMNYNLTLARHASRARAVQSFSVALVNSSCAALSWYFLPNVSLPESFIIEWKRRRREREQNWAKAVKWIRAPVKARDFYIYDTFFASEEYQFILYPIFLDGAGEPIYNKDDRGRPRGEHAAYVLLLIIAFLSIVLFVTLAISQHQMKKLVWKEVPNPNNCSWAQGVDFKKAETIENLFKHPESLTSCPLLLQSETISEAVIVENMKLPAGKKPASFSEASPSAEEECPRPVHQSTAEPVVPEQPPATSSETSAQSRIQYATVLIPEEPVQRYQQQKSISNSSDEGNFSANNSDISGSFPSSLWEGDNPSGKHSTHGDPRNSCPFTSSEEFSEASDQDDNILDDTGPERDLYYVGLASNDEEDGEEEEEERFLKEDAQMPYGDQREELLHESNPLLGCHSIQDVNKDHKDTPAKNIPLYMPQFRTVSSKIQHHRKPSDI